MTKPESTTSTRKIEAQEKERQAVELRKAGATFDAIARQLGYKDRSAAYNAVKRALEKLNAETAEDAAEVRRLELERLDAMLLSMWRQAKDGNQGAVDRVLRIMERRAKLLGLDATPASASLNVDLATLSEDQLARIAAGEDIMKVLGGKG